MMLDHAFYYGGLAAGGRPALPSFPMLFHNLSLLPRGMVKIFAAKIFNYFKI
jgi:hypothetical protein